MAGDYETRSLLNDAELEENADDEERRILESSHCHALLLSHKEEKGVERALRSVALLCALFIVAELVGGIVSDSLAIITDAGHLFSDFLSFIVSLLAIRFARHSPTRRATFGYARAEVIGALFSLFIIWALTIVLLVFATLRMQSSEVQIDTNVMLVTSLLAISFNVIMAIVLWCCGGSLSMAHGHSHSARESPSVSPSRSIQPEMPRNVNIRAAFVHILGDFIQSIGVLCASLIIKFTGWTMADPLCTYLFSVIVLITSFPVLRDICRIIMEASPSRIDYAQLYDDLMRLNISAENGALDVPCISNGVIQNGTKAGARIKAIHSLHVWALNTRQLCASVHVVIDKSVSPLSDAISSKVTYQLQHVHGIMHTTVQVEIDHTATADDSQCTNEIDDVASQCSYCKPL